MYGLISDVACNVAFLFLMCWHKTAPLNNCYIYTNTLSQIYKAEDLWMFECSLGMVYSHTQYRIAIHNTHTHTQYRIAIIAWNPEPSCFALVYFGLQLTPLPICFLISYYSSRWCDGLIVSWHWQRLIAGCGRFVR